MSLNRYLKVQNRSNIEGDLKFEIKKKVTWRIISIFEYLKHSDTKLGTYEQTHRDKHKHTKIYAEIHYEGNPGVTN